MVADLMLVDADGSNLRLSVQHDAPGAILETPSWSPDGRMLYFSYYAPTYQGDRLVSETIDVRRAEIGGAMATVVAGATSPTLSPDGATLAFVGEDPMGGQSLKVQSVGGGDPKELIGAEAFVSILAPRFSPDGSTIAFAAASLPTDPGTPSGGSSPLDWLAQMLGPATAYAHGLPWEIWTVAAAGGQPRQLTTIAEDMPHPAWSADGRNLLVFGGGGFYLVDGASGDVKTVSSIGAHGGMDWRP